MRKCILWITSWWMSCQLVSCMVHPPTSLHTGNYSATTALPLYAYYLAPELTTESDSHVTIVSGIGRSLLNPAPFPDYKVVHFGTTGRIECRDTFKLPARKPISIIERGAPSPPGGVYVSPIDLYTDEVEISNLDWHQFELAQLDAGVPPNELAPNVTALPVSDYYSSPFYAFYPVVAISYEQAQRFCQWRSKVVNEELARSHQRSLANLIFEYRLPTEAEWEEAAAVRSGQPYGTSCTEAGMHVAPEAAAYLRKRSATTTDLVKIKADIIAYDKQHPVRCWINYAQAEPYFLRLATPSYIYQGRPNYFGLYQMLGNAAELVQERGITKGGSYRDNLEACQIKARGTYTGPAPTIGFRAVCSVRRKQ